MADQDSSSGSNLLNILGLLGAGGLAKLSPAAIGLVPKGSVRWGTNKGGSFHFKMEDDQLGNKHVGDLVGQFLPPSESQHFPTLKMTTPAQPAEFSITRFSPTNDFINSPENRQSILDALKQKFPETQMFSRSQPRTVHVEGEGPVTFPQEVVSSATPPKFPNIPSQDPNVHTLFPYTGHMQHPEISEHLDNMSNDMLSSINRDFAFSNSKSTPRMMLEQAMGARQYNPYVDPLFRHFDK